MVTPSSCRASQIHICHIVSIRIAINYLVKLNHIKVFAFSSGLGLTIFHKISPRTHHNDL